MVIKVEYKSEKTNIKTRSAYFKTILATHIV